MPYPPKYGLQVADVRPLQALSVPGQEAPGSRNRVAAMIHQLQPVVQRTAQGSRSAPPAVYRPQSARPVVLQRFTPTGHAAIPVGRGAPPVYRPSSEMQRSTNSSSILKAPPLFRPAAPQRAGHTGTVQRTVIINRVRPYAGAEAIATMEYWRDGSAGGNHFVSDLMIQNIVKELVEGQTRTNAATRLGTLWTGCGFSGTFAVSTADTASYDASVNSLISGISNQTSNRFSCRGSEDGDGGGGRCDIPSTPTAQAQVLGYAAKLRAGLVAVNASLGATGRSVRDQLAAYIDHGF
jgi:hypothetical protein